MNTPRPRPTLRLVSRSSPLARVQVQELKDHLPGLNLEPFWLESFGDKNKNLSLWEPQASDFFTRELDQALREGRADAAVHSAKDLPCPLPEDLEVWALTPRQDPRDALVLHPDLEGKLRLTLKPGEVLTLAHLPGGTRIGTSSPSRRTQLEALRPDCPLVSIRGDIAGRLAYLDRDEADGIVVAACALDRLGWTGKISLYLDLETHPLQGHLAVVGLRSRSALAEVFRPGDVRQNWGTVWIAGAGPGDPRLLTLQVKDLISRADVILHDALGAPSVLEEARGELVSVGKRRGNHEMTQDQTNALLHRLALEGKTVLRLKGGDPFVFGRGSEEQDYLKSRMVDTRVVPGISSALGAAAAFGLPLTERGISRSVAFCTGWPEDQIQAPAADTLVYFMGAGSLATLARKNREAGKPGNTPVALISNATLPDQDIRFLTLEELEKPLEEKNTLPTPVLVFVGETARPDRPWFTPRKPGVLWYTGTDWETPPRSSQPEELRLFHHPLITFGPPENPKPWNTLVEELICTSALPAAGSPPPWHWIVFTSRQTVKTFFQALEDRGADTRTLAGIRIAAVGQATGRALRIQGIRPDLIPETETAEALGNLFPPAPVSGPPGGNPPRILLPTSQLAPSALGEKLREKGWLVEKVTLYTTLEAPGPEKLPAGLREIHFTSPSTVTSFFRQYGALPPGVRAVCRGPSTEKALAQFPSSGYDSSTPSPGDLHA